MAYGSVSVQGPDLLFLCGLACCEGSECDGQAESTLSRILRRRRLLLLLPKHPVNTDFALIDDEIVMFR